MIAGRNVTLKSSHILHLKGEKFFCPFPFLQLKFSSSSKPAAMKLPYWCSELAYFELKGVKISVETITLARLKKADK